MGKKALANGKEHNDERDKEGLTNDKEDVDKKGKEGLTNDKKNVNKKGKKGLSNDKELIDKKGKTEDLDKQSNAELRLGDTTWIKLRGASWWPAQVVDENAISNGDRPRRKGKNGEVLVRLYGTYTYSYMDPVTTLLEFDNVLKRHKGSQREIFLKSLEKDLAKLQSGKKNAGTAKAKGNNTPSKRVAEEQVAMEKKCKPNGLGCDDTYQTPEGNARRLKVMQNLGLTAPSGSPFIKNDEVSSAVQ